jgi:hypothetical protein
MKEPRTARTSLVTNRSGASEACGPSAIKWGFMCSIAARYNDSLYALNFTRTPDVAWDIMTPNEAPVAFWKRQPDGTWHTTLLDSPHRTYQTPSLLLGPDGRANVFTLKPGDDTLYWFQGDTSANTTFTRRAFKMGWGAYLSGAIDAQGRALMVYWGNGAGDPDKTGYEGMTSGYRKSTIGYTLVDTVKGTATNGVIDTPGAPYCYSQVAFDKNGAHVFTVRSEVMQTILCGSRNHYTEIRYYYSPDPASNAPWKGVTIYQDARSCIQPLGIEIDRAGRAHLLYYYTQEAEDRRIIPHRLMYAVSLHPISDKAPIRFVQHELALGKDGRLFQTRSGRIGVLAYIAGRAAAWREVWNGVEGKFSPWQPCDMSVAQCRLFPLSKRGGSTLTEDLEGVFLGVYQQPEQHSMFYFQLSSR